MELNLKPSLIANYFEHDCEKFLFYSSVDDETYEKLKKHPRKKGEDTAAILAGKEWERQLYLEKKKDPGSKVIGSEELDSLDKTIKALKTELVQDKTVYLYQAVLNAPDSFIYDNLAGSGKYIPVLFGDMKPDFIRAEYNPSEKKYCLTVIDAKNAGFPKAGAEIQIAIYTLILKSIIEDKKNKIKNCYVNTKYGIVWNKEKITNKCIENTFDLSDAYNAVDEFFTKTLVSVCKKLKTLIEEKDIKKALPYRISQKCEYCRNFEDCKSYCKSIKSVRLLPYITPEAQDRLDKLIRTKKLKNDSRIEVFKMLRNNRTSKALTDDCFFWKNVSNNLNAYEKALTDYFANRQEKQEKTGVSPYFPSGQDLALFLSAQQDVKTGRVYAYSWLLKPGYGIDIYDSSFGGKYKKVTLNSEIGTYQDSYVAKNSTKAAFDKNDEKFVNKLYNLFETIDNYDKVKKLPYTDKNGEDLYVPLKKLQVYVMDHYEKINIQDALFNILKDPNRVAMHDKAATILLWLQGERNVTELTDQAEECIEKPVIVLTTEISRLYALSSPVGYSLKDMPTYFDTYYKFNGNDKTNYLGVLTNVIEGMNVIKAWTGKVPKKETLDSLAFHMRKRLFVESDIVKRIQEDHRIKDMKLWPPQFSLNLQCITDPELASLNFENKYEQLLQYQQLRARRTSGIQLAIDNGTILSLEYVEKNKYKILNRDSYIGEEWFTPLLCKDDDLHRQRIMLLQDRSERLVNWLNNYKNSHPFTFPQDNTEFYKKTIKSEFKYWDNGRDAFVEFTPAGIKQLDPKKHDKFLLFGIFHDFNGSKVEACLNDLDKKKNARLRKQLLDPVKLAKNTTDSSSFSSRKFGQKGKSLNQVFSKSQKDAFEHLFKRKLTVLEGPPASGKSYFIARSIITLAEYYQKQGKSLKILVTALSHPAINNVLLKLNDILNNNNPSHIQLIKIVRNRQGIDILPSGIIEGRNAVETEGEILSRPGVPQVIGATCWAVSKLTDECQFDLIVIDEASQYRAMDSLIVFKKCKKDTRFLLVGDENQLPGIILGDYVKDEGKDIYGSVFRMFMTALGPGHKDIISLKEQFRMNAILCKYSAESIYGDDYKASNSTIGKRKIMLGTPSSDPLIDFILDKDYPLVFCELSGDNQNKTEIDLVTKIVSELNSNMIYAVNGFWNTACGIISPHHEHINKVKTSIANKLHISPEKVFIGTVDKLQGQERDAVIVSYGVSSIEKIARESEFIFSLERFNVSITRGKAKAIVFLSDVLVEPNLKTNVMRFRNPKLERGIDFIHGFTRFMKDPTTGKTVEKEFPGKKIKIWKKRLN